MPNNTHKSNANKGEFPCHKNFECDLLKYAFRMNADQGVFRLFDLNESMVIACRLDSNV